MGERRHLVDVVLLHDHGKNKLITYFANDTVKRTVLSATHLLGTFGPVFLLTYGENLLERIVDRAPFDQIEDASMVQHGGVRNQRTATAPRRLLCDEVRKQSLRSRGRS